MQCSLTKEVGVLEDVQLAVVAITGQVERLGLSLQDAQLITSFVVVVLNIGEVSLQTIQCVCGLTNAGSVWMRQKMSPVQNKTIVHIYV